jgi:hypothetical protein
MLLSEGIMSNMQSLSRGLGVALLNLALLGFVGCQPDNEKVVSDQASANAGKGDPGPVAKTPPPKNQTEYYQQQKQNDPYKAGGYPGAGKR